MSRRIVALLVMGVLLLTPSAAFAQEGAVTEEYPPTVEKVRVDRPRAVRVTPLPVTGTDFVVPAMAIGGVLVLIGSALVVSTRRRWARSPA